MEQASANIFDQGLPACGANYVPLSPLTFIERNAAVYPDYNAVVYGPTRRNWAQTYERCRRLASALSQRAVGRGDTVAVMLPNIPSMLEAHFGVPFTGGVLNALNTRLDADSIAYMLRHGEARVLIADTEYADVVEQALAQLDEPPVLVEVADPEGPGGRRLGGTDYEAFLEAGDPAFAYRLPDDEWDAISLNYTSGTTGNPKGVVYHHRGAYLNAIGNMCVWAMPHHPVYLWTLPMFHCNGWCFPWTVTAAAGTHVCLRKVDPAEIMELLREEGITHFCGAPIILNALVNLPEADRRPLKRTVRVVVGGAAPPAATLAEAEALGIEVTHGYGLTEVYGLATVCAWRNEWDQLPLDERARIKARQGVRSHVQEGLRVVDQQTGEPVPRDGQALGEVVIRGNTVMKGYLKNEAATREAFADGWYHTGDLAVWHPDGYIDLKDRLKDIIISGGENISTIELEDVLFRHPAVAEAAVVAKPDEKWGETPCAYVTLKPGHDDVTEGDIIDHCRSHLARFKVPRHVVFSELPKTSTGKIQKYVLRRMGEEITDD
ncbi:acyl-CoA synthetase [Arhodomonas aquaeolei]|uniref:acyl-CoA synthetase n=1 Tax=Arhodomonas aquaeolei TaxID=2369 RepID=UPI000366067B|nr:acyl-CoA synthetase [Arhodomonas aquaeolei]